MLWDLRANLHAQILVHNNLSKENITKRKKHKIEQKYTKKILVFIRWICEEGRKQNLVERKWYLVKTNENSGPVKGLFYLFGLLNVK